MNVSSATYIPILPIKLATLSSFYYKGVPSSSSSKSFSSTSPVYVSYPTAHIIAVPFPKTTMESPNKNGLGIYLDFSLRGNFLTCSLSPVMLLSSV
jgi:hypothetical protein